ncbi:hypothetical protein HDV57DRAFT_297954 [Trichoderma longibrachiatum]|uniref:Uncharacterized protein n=1 Tax=Trichoderma longibrachiatum ATCC 18648 TaxID=983965 RepID=A0A2T4CCQ2_TRILO|nr:hypothetical protein M440DRAFT_1165986 [Trichoderma longibrachiatum ATCC 18648]
MPVKSSKHQLPFCTSQLAECCTASTHTLACILAHTTYLVPSLDPVPCSRAKDSAATATERWHLSEVHTCLVHASYRIPAWSITNLLTSFLGQTSSPSSRLVVLPPNAEKPTIDPNSHQSPAHVWSMAILPQSGQQQSFPFTSHAPHSRILSSLPSKDPKVR